MTEPTKEQKRRVIAEFQRCAKCGQLADSWRDCWNCDESGYAGHDCGDDTCCCLVPHSNIKCDICQGRGGFYVCDGCYPEEM